MTNNSRPAVLRLALTASTLASLLVVAACSAPDGTPVPSGAPPVVASALQAAIDAGASEAQIAILRAAALEGRDVNEEDYRQATESAMQCTRDSGMTGSVDVSEGFDRGGIYLSIGVVVADPEDQTVLQMMADCERSEQDLVESAYQTRAESVQWMDALYAAYLPSLLACVRAKGVTVPDDVSIDDLFTAEHEANPDEFETRCAATTGFEAEVNGM